MAKKNTSYLSEDGNLELLVANDGSKAELKVAGNLDLISDTAIEMLLKQAEVKYGFSNARAYCEERSIKREPGDFFLIALADDISFEPEVEILLEPLDCLLSQRLYAISDLSRVRFINAGEKLAKVKTGSGNIRSKNIFDREIRDLAADKNFLDTYLGSNVEFDRRRSMIVAKTDGYGLVENNKKISIIDNIFLQQDIMETGHEVKTSLTLDGSIFDSDLMVGGNLTVKGKIEGCKSKGIVVNGDINLGSAEDSLIIVKGDLNFLENLQDCQVFANGKVQGKDNSLISGGNIQAGLSIYSGSVENSQQNTQLQISIAPFIKGMMIQISKKLRGKGWDPALPEADDPMVKVLQDLEIRFAKEIPNYLSNNRPQNKITSLNGFEPETYLRIHNLSWLLDGQEQQTVFALEQ